MFKKVILFFLTALLLISFLSGCTERLGVGPACVGYSVSDGTIEQYGWHQEEKRTLPAEFVRIFALYTALEGGAELSEQEAAAVLFDYSASAMKKVVDAAGGREALLAEMNVIAADEELSHTVFGSLTGSEKAEGDLTDAYATAFSFADSFSDLCDMGQMAMLFAEQAELAELLSRLSYKFPGESNAKYRNAQLLRKDSEFYLENVLVYLAGSVAFPDGSSEYIAITVLTKGDAVGVSVVAERSGRDPAEMFAASDGANLAGKIIGENYNFIYHPTDENTQGKLFIGADWFVVIIVLLAVLIVGLIVLMIVVGIITTAKRNAEARKKYCGKE